MSNRELCKLTTYQYLLSKRQYWIRSGYVYSLFMENVMALLANTRDLYIIHCLNCKKGYITC